MCRVTTIKDAKHVADKRPDLVCLALFFLVDVLQMRNHVHDFFQSLRHFLFLFLEFVNEFVHVIEAAFAFGTVGGRLQDGGTLIVGENDVTGSAAADGNLQ